jgi:hypothetical protein
MDKGSHIFYSLDHVSRQPVRRKSHRHNEYHGVHYLRHRDMSFFISFIGGLMRRFLLACSLLVLGCISLVAITQAEVGPCPVFPEDNYWNQDVSAEPVHPQSAAIIANINSYGGDNVHPDFGGTPADHYGIPWITVTNAQPNTNVEIVWYPEESYLGPYPIPYNAPTEGLPDEDGDRHVIVINTDTCTLYELYAAYSLTSPQRWEAGSGAKFNLNINDHWPDTWTSADAAGLPIFPGLARCDEASAGLIEHALRFTISKPRQAPGYTNGVQNNVYVFPARHEAGNNTDPMSPPFGARLRLKADYPEAGFQGQALAIVKALKRYGMILADIGSNWYISGDYPVYQPGCWNDDQLQDLKDIPGTAFEVLAYPGTSAPNAPHFSTLTPTLTWARVTWAASYEVQVDDVATFTSPMTYTASGTSVTLSPALTEDTFYWRVRAKAADNTLGNWSTTGSFVIALIP